MLLSLRRQMWWKPAGHKKNLGWIRNKAAAPLIHVEANTVRPWMTQGCFEICRLDDTWSEVVFFFPLTFTNLIGWHQVGWFCVPRIYRSPHGPQFVERPFLGAESINHNNNKYIKANSSSTAAELTQTRSPAHIFERISWQTHTFSKTKGSSFHTGLMALGVGDHLVRYFFLGSPGSPITSTSTPVFTFLSDRNWPE